MRVFGSKSGTKGSARAAATSLLAGALVVSYGAVAGAAPFDVSITNDAVSAEYLSGTGTGTAVYEVEVVNTTGAPEVVSPTITPTLPDGATLTGVSATAVDAAGADLTTVSGKPDGAVHIIDEERPLAAGQKVTYTVTVGYSYTGTPTDLSCDDGGGIQTTAAITPDAPTTVESCVDAPAPPADESSSEAPQSEDEAPSEEPAPEASAKEAPAAPQAQSESLEITEPQAEVAAQSAPAAPQDPVGTFTATVNDGLISFSGYAYDPSDMNVAPAVMWILNGQGVAFSVANKPSPQLYPYGVFYRGVSGSMYAPGPGSHSLCMYVINVGAGADQLTKCMNLNVASGDPVGDFTAQLNPNGDLSVSGYAFDPSNPYAQTAVWITDNGNVAAAFTASFWAPDLSAYGVPGNHGLQVRWAPTTYGTHTICMYIINIGWGNSVWPKCVDITVSPDAARDNPRGDFMVSHGQGGVGVTGWAYDPNNHAATVTTMWTVDGNVVAYLAANQPHAGVNVNLGVGGHHGVTGTLPASVGWHTVCQYVFNIGLGYNDLVRCANVQVVSPPNPCPAYAKACIDLTNNTTWLQSNGQIYYGPVKQIAGRAGYRTPPGTFRVFWKNIDHKSSIFNNAPMPYAIFFNGGIAFHVGSLYVPSHGCIHLTWDAARVYWDNLQVGDIVYVFGAAQY